MTERLEVACPHCRLVGIARFESGDGSKLTCPRCRYAFKADGVPSSPIPSDEAEGMTEFAVWTPPKPFEPAKNQATVMGVRVEKRPLFEWVDVFPHSVWMAYALAALMGVFGALSDRNIFVGIGIFFAIALLSVPLLVMGSVGAYIADQKGRDEKEGFAFGFWLGPLGWIIVGLLPNIPKNHRPAGPDEP